MYINPKVAIANGWITGTIADNTIQPNAIDFTLDKLFNIDHDMQFIVSEQEKCMRGSKEIEAQYEPENFYHWWSLEAKTSYDAMSSMYVKLPEGIACNLIIRSTFNRNGIFLTSGLYDSGYEGHIGFAIHNNSGPAKIATGTRVGQIMFVESDSAKMYAGGYNHGEGTHHSYRETTEE